jgi:hypothetical protein
MSTNPQTLYWPCPKCGEPSARVVSLGRGDDGLGTQCLTCMHEWRRDGSPPQPIDGHIDSLEKLYQVFTHLKPGWMAIHNRAELPMPPKESRWHEYVLLIKATGPERMEPWWMIALLSDQEKAIAEVHRMIENLGGEVTSAKMEDAS